jgi:hypothetical protein
VVADTAEKLIPAGYFNEFGQHITVTGVTQKVIVAGDGSCWPAFVFDVSIVHPIGRTEEGMILSDALRPLVADVREPGLLRQCSAMMEKFDG